MLMTLKKIVSIHVIERTIYTGIVENALFSACW